MISHGIAKANIVNVIFIRRSGVLIGKDVRKDSLGFEDIEDFWNGAENSFETRVGNRAHFVCL